MTVLRMKDIKNMSEKEREEKLKELKLELIKRKTGKETKVKAKEIKKAIARLLMLSRTEKKITK